MLPNYPPKIESGNGLKEQTFDVIILGGLAGLIVAAGLDARPQLRVVLLDERRIQEEPQISFFSPHALRPQELAIVEPAMVAVWEFAYSINEYRRDEQHCNLCLIHEAQLRASLAEGEGFRRIETGVSVVKVEAGRVLTDRGHFEAGVVIDAREPPPPRLGTAVHLLEVYIGYERSSLLDLPIILDTTHDLRGWSLLQYVPVGADHMLVRGVGHGRAGEALPVSLSEARSPTSIRSAFPVMPVLPHAPDDVVTIPSGGVDPLLPSIVPLALRAATAIAQVPELTPGACRTALALVRAQHASECLRRTAATLELANSPPDIRSLLLDRLLTH
jgi:hypothetical protein